MTFVFLNLGQTDVMGEGLLVFVQFPWYLAVQFSGGIFFFCHSWVNVVVNFLYLGWLQSSRHGTAWHGMAQLGTVWHTRLRFTARLLLTALSLCVLQVPNIFKARDDERPDFNIIHVCEFLSLSCQETLEYFSVRHCGGMKARQVMRKQRRSGEDRRLKYGRQEPFFCGIF